MTETYGNRLRLCGACSAWLLMDVDGGTPTVYCRKCQAKRPTWDQWAEALKPGDSVYLYKYAAWRGMCRSQYVITERDGRSLTVQLIGIPESRMAVDVTCCTQEDMNAWNNKAMY